ncbi:hypothetical protein ACFPIJ_31935 [Dactylosporangium cerinum]|uniref:Uncharacterized protein n=1 Tax=Dactylosporangium cerinum TaxID=1434730 RepID=A0ABV9W547_9ACTN
MTVIAWYGSSFAYYDEEPQTDEELDAAAVHARARPARRVLAAAVRAAARRRRQHTARRAPVAGRWRRGPWPGSPTGSVSWPARSCGNCPRPGSTSWRTSGIRCR